MSEVVYLTGAPAAGKSSLVREIRARAAKLKVFEYGEQLTAYLQRTKAAELSQDELRTQSSLVATPEDIAAVDRLLLEFVATHRTSSPVIIDSHAVTKERYGFRVTPYALSDFSKLNPTQIWMLYVPTEVAQARIAADAGGRPQISADEAQLHTHLQASVAATYAMHLGVPLHLFDNSGSRDAMAAQLVERLRR